MSTPLQLLNLGIKGLLSEVAREQLDVEHLWMSRNFWVSRGKLGTSPGTKDFYSGTTLNGRPLFYLPWYRVGGNKHLNLVTNTRIYSATELAVVTNITRVAGDYTGGVTDLWDGVSFKDLAIFTNRVDDIQKWDGTSANCVALGGSPPKAGTIFAMMTFVFLGNTVETNGERIIRWSDNGFPEIWTGGDSGFLILYQSSGKILRGLPLGEVSIVYKADSVHMLYYVGPPYQFGQRQIFADGGIVGPRAVADLGGIHIYWGHDNVYLFNGSERTGVASGIIRDLMDSVDPAYRGEILAVPNFREHEVYFAYTPKGSTYNTRAWVFNWLTQAWRQEDIEITAGCPYRKISTPLSWDTLPGTWDTLPGTWETLGPQAGENIILTGNTAGKVGYVTDETVDQFGVARDRYFETGLIQPGDELFDHPTIRCTLEYIEVELEKTGSHNLELWVGTQDQLTGDANISWSQYNIKCDGTQRKIRISKTARYFAFRGRTSGSEQPVRLSGITPYFTARGDSQGKLG